MMSHRTEFVVVLCRAREAGNVGAVCRAMAAMGLSRLILVGCPEYPPEPVRTFALKAYPIFESAPRFDTLESALADCSLAAGFTRRSGRLRVREPRPLTDFAREAVGRSGRIALVFGTEADGLSSSELALCDLAVRIPTAEAFPSLNLAQAVQIAAWEIARVLTEPDRGTSPTKTAGPAPRSEIIRAVEDAADDLARVGFFKIAGRPALVRFLRSLLARAGVTTRELEYFRSILGKAAALSGRRSGSLRPDSRRPEP